jgi:sulfur-carrier protein
MTITVQLWSYFRDLAGTGSLTLELPEHATVGDAQAEVYRRHPKLAALRNSTLLAVGVDYQGPSHPLRPGDELSLFPPVQGG